MELNKIYNENCIDTASKLADESIDCVITSPPYWGLRDYGTATWEGGRSDCDHSAAKEKSRYDYSLDSSPIQDGSREGTDAPKYKDVCPTCGAIKIDDQFGLEKTPEEYVDNLVKIFREIKRALKKEGTVWLNIGDSYNGSGQDSGKKIGTKSQSIGRIVGEANPRKRTNAVGLKPKDLVGIPWRVALALQADGWYLRQDIIWHKPNPMPESVTDRCTKAHEYIFLLTKSPKYYYDNEAIRERLHGKDERKWADDYENSGSVIQGASNSGLKKTKRYRKFGAKNQEGTNRNDQNNYFSDNGSRNKRSVWTVNTKPYKEAHFAVFPEELIAPCVLAGCPEGGVIYDPFIGSGTTAYVAIKYQRKFIGSELNPEYVKLAERRISQIIDQEVLAL